MTTPYEREVLTHHYTCSEPFPCQTILYSQTVERFVELGLLVRAEGVDRPLANCDAMEPYMAALAAVPLPVQRWIVPATGEQHG